MSPREESMVRETPRILWTAVTHPLDGVSRRAQRSCLEHLCGLLSRSSEAETKQASQRGQRGSVGGGEKWLERQTLKFGVDMVDGRSRRWQMFQTQKGQIISLVQLGGGGGRAFWKGASVDFGRLERGKHNSGRPCPSPQSPLPC